MKMISVDIETTGLEPQVHGIIQIGAVAFELGKEPMGAFFIEIDPENMVWSQYCLDLHYDWIGDVNARKRAKTFDGARYAASLSLFKDWAAQYGFYQFEPGRKTASKPTVSGKCFGTFDANFLNFRWMEEAFRKRVMDPAHYYVDFEKDGDILPDLTTCKARAIATGCKSFDSAEVTHNALDDARDVMHLLNHAFTSGFMSLYSRLSY